MSSSESIPNPASLQASIEQLIADAVRQSSSAASPENNALRAVLEATLTDIEAQQAALATTAERLRTALVPADTNTATESVTMSPSIATSVDGDSEEPDAPAAIAENAGPHTLDVIAHGATLAAASGLQSLLRTMPAVGSVQTRQFVHGELRLLVEMTSNLDSESLEAWLTDNDGRLASATSAVVEIRFNS